METASLAAVEPPDIAYQLHLDDLVAAGDLSALQVPHPPASPPSQRPPWHPRRWVAS